MLQLIQQVILVAGTLAGAITDTRTGYIYDWITYPMILLGIILSISQGQITNLILAGLLFIILFVTYKLGKLGGGDVKLFTGICLLNPYNDINFIATTILTAAILSMIFYSTFYLVKYARKGINLEKNKEGIIKAGALEAIIIIYVITTISNNIITLQAGGLILIVFTIGLGFVALHKEIKKEFFEKKLKLSELEEDEIISKNNTKEVLLLLKGKELIDQKEIELLKKNKIKEIIVFRNLPKFGPFIFLGVITTTIYPNLIMLLLLPL